MKPAVRRAKLSKLCEIEGFEDENALFAAAMTDSVCPVVWEGWRREASPYPDHHLFHDVSD
jgi:hypothetical protein